MSRFDETAKAEIEQQIEETENQACELKRRAGELRRTLASAHLDNAVRAYVQAYEQHGLSNEERYALDALCMARRNAESYVYGIGPLGEARS